MDIAVGYVPHSFTGPLQFGYQADLVLLVLHKYMYMLFDCSLHLLQCANYKTIFWIIIFKNCLLLLVIIVP